MLNRMDQVETDPNRTTTMRGKYQATVGKKLQSGAKMPEVLRQTNLSLNVVERWKQTSQENCYGDTKRFKHRGIAKNPSAKSLLERVSDFLDNR